LVLSDLATSFFRGFDGRFNDGSDGSGKGVGQGGDTDGDPVIGASIQVKGMQVGTVTDLNGSFSAQLQISVA
jgi:hypothetical protein